MANMQDKVACSKFNLGQASLWMEFLQLWAPLCGLYRGILLCLLLREFDLGFFFDDDIEKPRKAQIRQKWKNANCIKDCYSVNSFILEY